MDERDRRLRVRHFGLRDLDQLQAALRGPHSQGRQESNHKWVFFLQKSKIRQKNINFTKYFTISVKSENFPSSYWKLESIELNIIFFYEERPTNLP